MRKAILILLACLGLATAQAQVTLRPGILTGLNMAKLTNAEMNFKPDFYVGVYGALKLSKFYTFQEEISYSRQGGKTSSYTIPAGFPSSGYLTTRTTATLQYLSATTINKFSIGKAYLLFGPQVDILIASNFKMPGVLGSENLKGQDIDLGLTGGLGYSFNKNIAAEARIKKGFIEAAESGSGPTVTNLVLQFGIAYTFGKK